MLHELRVRDLGVVHDVTVPFGEGLTVLTGETGAGKTLLVEALAIVLGCRAGARVVRNGSAEALVEARFWLQERGEVILARALRREGRARAWIDGRMATASSLEDVGASLVDIHGQHERHSLLETSGQRRALDTFGGIDDSDVRGYRRQLRDLDRAIAERAGTPQEHARRIDMLRFQIAEIARAGLQDPAEDERLSAEEERLADLGAYRAAAEGALWLLGGGHQASTPVDDVGGALERIADAAKALSGRPSFAALVDRLHGAAAELDDAAGELHAMLEDWQDDPQALAAVQERRQLLAQLRRKYGPTLQDVIRFTEEARCRLAELEGLGEEVDLLRARRDAVEAQLQARAATVRAARQEAACRLGTAVATHLRKLAMPQATAEVVVGDGGAGDDVRFLLAANPGEGAKPLAQVASGGELARATLALRLVSPGGPSTVVFDEVDTGVGGEAALALARALAEVATQRQVLVVTHLAQVAAFADHHVAVRKDVRDGRTTVQAVPITGEERVVELSRMLSGRPDSKTARAHARELLATARGDDGEQGAQARKGPPRGAGRPSEADPAVSTSERAARR